MTVGATITGIGFLTAMGRRVDDVFDALCAGRSGLSVPPAGHPVAGWMEIAGIVPDIDPGEVMPPTEAKSVDKYVLLAMAAADDALSDAGIEVGRDVDPARTAVLVSTGGGGFGVYEQYDRARLERGASAVSPYLLPGILSNMATARIAIKHGIRGYSASLVMACAAGTQSIVEGVRLINDGEADVAICGAGEASLLATIGAGFTNARVLARGWTTDPTEASRPFDKRRNGIVVSEGACVVIVERTDFATARHASGYADVIGWGCSTDAYHPTKPRPDGEGAMASMRKAIARAGCEPSDVDYVNAHATSTTIGDVAEALAINTVFGPHSPPVSSIKSVTGHMLGASGALEAAATALSVSRGILPPTANLDDPDPKCDLNHVRGAARTGSVRIALSNTFAFGGHNIGLLFGPPGTASKRSKP